MIFAVAGAVLAASLIFGSGALVWVSQMQEKKQPAEKLNKEKRSMAPVAAWSSFFKKDNRHQWTAVSLAALLCTGAMCMVWNPQIWFLDFARLATVLWVLLCAMFIDYYTHRIPNSLILAALGSGAVFLLLELLLAPQSFKALLISSLVGLLCCLVIFYLSSRLTKEGLGMGDVKLISAMGWLLGLPAALKTVLLALIICTVAALFLLFGKKKSKKDTLAFGPFLFFGYIGMLILSGL